MAETISILGCGWLGWPLAKRLVAAGYRVKGSTRSAEKVAQLRADGIAPYLIDLSPAINLANVGDFFQSDRIIINIPPGRSRENVEEFHTAQIDSLKLCLNDARLRQVIFVSSTSVYRPLNRIVVEGDAGVPETDSGRAVFKAERTLARSAPDKLTIVRFGGLLGGDRHPGRFLARKEYTTDPDSPTNLIGLEDCLGILAMLIEKDIVGSVFNACCDEHPTRREFYTRESAKLGIEPPRFQESPQPTPWKIVSSEKLKAETGYRFIHPDPSDVFPANGTPQ